MSITWTGSADFSGTLTSGGPSWNALTIPAGKAPSEQAWVVVAIAFTVTPGTSFSVATSWNVGFFDVNGHTPTSQYSGSGGFQGSGFRLRETVAALNKIAGGANAATCGATDDLNAGGDIRVTLPISSGSEAIVATVVACIVDGDGFFSLGQAYGGGIVDGEGGSTPVHATNWAGGSTFLSSGPTSVFTGNEVILGSVGLVDTPPATAPSFTGSAGWANLITRTNGGLYAGIGNLTGPYSGVYSYSVAHPLAQSVSTLWDLYSNTGAAVAQRRNFAAIIG